MADDIEDNERASLVAQRNALLASKLAAEHIPACIAELARLTTISGRPGVRRRAAADLIRIATQLPSGGELDQKARTDRGGKSGADRRSGGRRDRAQVHG